MSKAHWVKPELVAEVTYLTWSDEGLSRFTVFVGLREDKPAWEVRRETPAPRNNQPRSGPRLASIATDAERPEFRFSISRCAANAASPLVANVPFERSRIAPSE